MEIDTIIALVTLIINAATLIVSIKGHDED